MHSQLETLQDAGVVGNADGVVALDLSESGFAVRVCGQDGGEGIQRGLKEMGLDLG